MRSAILVALAGACVSSTGGGQITIGGQRFSIESEDEFPHPVPSIEEMERVGGFAFVFPSYLPEGMNETVALGAWAGGEESVDGVIVKKGGPEESLMVYREHGGDPLTIIITEKTAPSPEGWSRAFQRFHTVAGTDIFCRLFELHGPVLTCGWLVGDTRFDIGFYWAEGSPIPGIITDDMRKDALRVIESMIVAPYHP